MTMTENWTKEWERQIVNGVYPLRRFLGRSNHSAVFFTECKAHNVAQAAIKILPADPALGEAQLANWRGLATLSHPHLIRLLDAGRCQLGGQDFLFVVMEAAEQTLAEILPGRALTPDEVRELLPATLDALAYLHGKNLVQGGLKPPNFLVVDDRLKLASDTIRPAGERTANSPKPSLYDPPEVENGRGSAAGDIWGLGITLVEALTQSPPAWSRERFESVSLPANLAPEFVDTVQRCLHRDPGRRPAIAELAAQFKQARPLPPPSPPPDVPPSPPPDVPPSPPSDMPPPSPSAVLPSPPPDVPPPSAAPPVLHEPFARTLSTPQSTSTRFLVTAITMSSIALWAVWAGVHRFHTRARTGYVASIAPQSLPAVSQPAISPPVILPPAVSTPAAVETPNVSIAAALPTVLYQKIPTVSRRARESIRGVIEITVHVKIDHSGTVVAATLDNRVSSKYFSRAAMDAARQWKFSQAVDQASRLRLLEFEFTRAGTTARVDGLP